MHLNLAKVDDLAFRIGARQLMNLASILNVCLQLLCCDVLFFALLCKLITRSCVVNECLVSLFQNILARFRHAARVTGMTHHTQIPVHQSEGTTYDV